jgi:hypothetical protein
MANLRLIVVNVIDSTDISAKFTEKLDPRISVSNISIISQEDDIPNPAVLSVTVVNDTLNIVTQPMTPLAAYFIIFQSTDTIIFKSINGDAVLLNDGVTNQQLIIGPTDPGNVVQDFLINYLNPRDSIYEKITDSSSIINAIIQMFSQIMFRSLNDIHQIKNENYLSYNVIDEQKIRGSGPFDRLSEEGAYEILRVARTPTNTSSTLNFNFSSFGRSPVSLLATAVTELMTVSNSEETDTFSIEDFTITVANHNVSKLTQVIFSYSDARAPYTYNISTFGYQILNSRYDQDFSFSFALLQDNQFKLSTTILSDPLFSTNNILNVQVSYEYRDLGRIIDPNSVSVTTVLTSSRETLPPIINVFNLKHAPVTDSSGNIPSLSGITFVDPNALTPTQSHPAFITELPFRLNAMPVNPGEYSIDYPNGTVYVFGADLTNSGTGPFPPLATYNYLYAYKSEIDYVYDADSNDLVALPNGSLILNAGQISFSYEEVLVPGIDYNADVHIENLSERIENRLLDLNVVATQNSPITNVFRIFNETSGEVYNLVRWFNNKIYFTFNNPPNVLSTTAERASFENVFNETLFINSTLINTNSIQVIKCLLANNNLISGTEDGIGSSINSTVQFSNTFIFQNEKWFDINELEIQNISRLQIGQYQIDYANGIVYCAVSNNQNIDIGTVSYKMGSVVPTNSHVISVEDIYYRISIANPKDKTFSYTSFGEGFINPKTFDPVDEAYLNSSIGAPYQLLNNQIGAFVGVSFFPTVSNNIKFLRGIFEFNDLQNNIVPINFAPFSTFVGRTITVNPISAQEYGVVLFDGTNYYVNINIDLPYLSNNITFNIAVIRNLDGDNLWNNSGTIILGNPVKLILPGINSPHVNDAITITYSFEINDLSRVIVDYNKGDYFIDYTFLADEIIVSYEYGDNYLDFRQSLSIPDGTQYFVSYKVGALRDALLKNFGTLINIPELSTFEVDFERERYRDALSAAFESFIQGPTLSAIKNIVNQIAHIEPEIIESEFQNWSLGTSLLTPSPIQTNGSFELVSSKYDTGILVNSPGQTISFPVSSNIKLKQGTFESWISPEWSGIDNNSNITISVAKDGYVFPSNFIFIGAAELHPTYVNNSFTLNKNDTVLGIPNKNKDGVYIYYAEDNSTLFNRWYLDVVDGYSDGYNDGYSDGYSSTYVINVITDGLFYNVKSISIPQPNNLSIRSGLSSIKITISGPTPLESGITFVADYNHYLLDFGQDINSNRLSIYKDPSGYFNFRVYDRRGTSYSISADVSSWRQGDLHHVAASWKLNTIDNQDEMHLFIDGLETPNIIKYGNKVGPYLHEKYRTINPEEIAGVINYNIVGSVDLVTTANSNVVTSSLNFSALGIVAGNILYINEPGFSSSGYNIINVNGDTLTLSVNLPFSITNGQFSVNQTALKVITEIDIYPNIAVSTISSIFDGHDMSASSNSDVFTSTGTNFNNLGVLPGYLVRIDNASFASHYVILSVSGHSLTVNGNAPITVSNATFHIYTGIDVEIPGVRALRPSYTISDDANFNPILTLMNNVKANDLILIKTLGINHKRTRQKFYQWSNANNVITTYLPSPISLNQVEINHILLTSTIINNANSSVIGSNFSSNNISTDQPSISDNGRTLSITISTNNIDFSTPVSVNVNGKVGNSTITETVMFSEAGTNNTINKFKNINFINVSGKFIYSGKTFLTIFIEEAFPITTPENSLVYPVLRYSYQTRSGTTLTGVGGNVVTDQNSFFSSQDIGNYIAISYPPVAAGTFQILAVSDDHKSATINATLPSFSDGMYQILNVTSFRSGFQNGFFVFEQASTPGQPYFLNQGWYAFDYYTYLFIELDPIDTKAFIGTDFTGNNNINAIIDETKIVSIMLTDTRIGESVPSSQETVTKDFNSLKALTSDMNTLFLCHYDAFPLTNDADFYIIANNKNFVQSNTSINENFTDSIYITNKPIIIDNNGILNSTKEGTIEFWINPHFDSMNDPNFRYYFDAAALVVENVVSINEDSVKTQGSISQVISVKLQNGDPNIDYFAGGRVEIDTTGAISEGTLSLTSSSLTVSKHILQVVTVKISNDPTNTDYFANGAIGTDGQTIYLGKQLPQNNLSLIVVYVPTDRIDKNKNSQIIRLNKSLPNSQTPVIVTYIPNGSQGDRISIFKDVTAIDGYSDGYDGYVDGYSTNHSVGFINFNVRASNIDYLLRAPIVWAKNTWHRIKATYKFNTGTGEDQIRLFVDGYEKSTSTFGTGFFGNMQVFGEGNSGIGGLTGTINFKDTINELFIGSDYNKNNGAFASISNFRISNIARPVFAPFGESIDVNYNSNLSAAFPVTSDLYTTLLLDFNNLLELNTDFVTLQNKKTGAFDFSVNILDSFDIVKNSARVKQVLESLINTLKPANSRAFIKYIS